MANIPTPDPSNHIAANSGMIVMMSLRIMVAMVILAYATTTHLTNTNLHMVTMTTHNDGVWLTMPLTTIAQTLQSAQ